MHQAQVISWGAAPTYTSVTSIPSPSPDEVRVKVLAVGVHRVVRSRSSGGHYSSGSLPHIPGIDGVGTTEDGQRVYFFSMQTGTFADLLNVAKTNVFPIPEGLDTLQIAAGVNPAMSSWMALKGRTSNLPKNWTCLVVGATSASGRVAIGLAKALGAKKVIGAARNSEKMKPLGLDGTIVLANTAGKTDFGDLDDVDVILDYVYGDVAVELLSALKTPKPVQYVHIGSLSGKMDVNIPGEILRSKDITIRGSGPGAWSMKSFIAVLPELLHALEGVSEQKVRVALLEDIEQEWSYQGTERLVFVPEALEK